VSAGAGARAGEGRLIVLSGPSGVGKDTVLRRLFELCPELRYSVSYTTRPPRPDEVDGVSYSFIDEPTFRLMLARDEFLESADVYGSLYGTSLQRVREALARGEDIVLKIDVQGAAQVRERVPGAVLVFLLPPSDDELFRRLRERGTDAGQALELRLENATAELAEAANYDHRVVNDEIDRAAREILAIVADSRGANPQGPG
jgi:guanylate kinase